MKNHFFGKCHSEETKKHLREVHPDFSGEKNPFYGKTHSIETRKQMSESRANGIANGRIPNKNGFGTKSWYHSTKTNEDVYCDSLLEKFRMIQLDHDPCVTYWTKKHHIKIQYLDTKQRNYVPDFLITLTSGELILEEIKGYDIRANVKYEALKRYCLEHGLKYNWIDQAALENEGYRKFVESQR